MTPYRSVPERIASGDLAPPPIAQLLGFRLTNVGGDQAVIEMDAGPQHANPMGTLHGGVLCDLADAAMGMAYASGLAADETFTTLELKMNFLKPVWTGRLTATGVVVKRGKTIGMGQCDVLDAQGQLVSRSSCTMMTLRGDKAKGR